MDSPGKNTGVGCHALLQGIFPTQRQNPRLLHLLHWQARFFTTSTTWEAFSLVSLVQNINFSRPACRICQPDAWDGAGPKESHRCIYRVSAWCLSAPCHPVSNPQCVPPPQSGLLAPHGLPLESTWDFFPLYSVHSATALGFFPLLVSPFIFLLCLWVYPFLLFCSHFN